SYNREVRSNDNHFRCRSYKGQNRWRRSRSRRNYYRHNSKLEAHRSRRSRLGTEGIRYRNARLGTIACQLGWRFHHYPGYLRSNRNHRLRKGTRAQARLVETVEEEDRLVEDLTAGFDAISRPRKGPVFLS